MQRLRVVARGRSSLCYVYLASGCELGVHPGLSREDAAACTTKIEQTGEINEQTTRRIASYRCHEIELLTCHTNNFRGKETRDLERKLNGA